jgi:hypothetical protein
MLEYKVINYNDKVLKFYKCDNGTFTLMCYEIVNGFLKLIETQYNLSKFDVLDFADK